MKTEAELLEAQKQKEEEEDPTPDILFSVVYTQDSLQTSQVGAMQDHFSNVEAFADADFDMDIDCNFHESESLFFNKLGFVKRDEDNEDDSSEEESSKSKAEASKSKEANAQSATEEETK